MNPPTPRALTPGRRLAYTAFALLMPVLLFLLVEGVLRLAWPAGAIPAFIPSPAGAGLLMANPRIATRWFPTEAQPPVPQRELFAATKPPNGFRVFVLGESTTAGFPYPRNVTFSRMIRDVLRDVLPADSVEVVNLGIAATNSHAVRDLVDDVIAQQPDVVLLYAGHNEYYGALGVGSTERLPGGDALVRLYLRLQRWRTFMAVRRGVDALRREEGGAPADSAAASFMEALAGNRAIALGDDAYRRGGEQFGRNLRAIIGDLRAAGIPVFIGSLASNIGDQAPFAAPANDAAGGAREAYLAGKASLARGDTAAARTALTKARDLDVVRFRAPSEFNDIVRRVADDEGAVYIPVAETFASVAPHGIPGGTLFLEHVHPTEAGYALLARIFATSLLQHPIVRDREENLARQRSWDVYANERWLTPLDTAIAMHTVRTLAARWPFVPLDRQRDYRGTYQPTSLQDTLAFHVSRGDGWEEAKVALAQRMMASGDAAGAAAELRGLVRDAPTFPEPRELLGRALLAAGLPLAADSAYRTAHAIRPTATNTAALGFLAMQARDAATAVSFFRESLALAPAQPNVMYQLSLAYGAVGDVVNARRMAADAMRAAPDLPGLRDWITTLSRVR